MCIALLCSTSQIVRFPGRNIYSIVNSLVSLIGDIPVFCIVSCYLPQLCGSPLQYSPDLQHRYGLGSSINGQYQSSNISCTSPDNGKGEYKDRCCSLQAVVRRAVSHEPDLCILPVEIFRWS